MDDMNGNGSMLEVYLFEANQLIDQLEEIMLQTEKEGGLTSDNINEIFRIMHTIKGSSAMMAFDNISKLAHSVEDLFFYIRENKPEGLDISQICDLVLSASDFIKAEDAEISNGGKADGDCTDIEARIKEYLSKISGKAAVKPEKKPAEKPKKEAAQSKAAAPEKEAQGKKYIARVYFDEGGQMENLRAYTIYHNLSEMCTELYSNPPDLVKATSEQILESGFMLFFSTLEEEGRIRELFEDALFLKSFEVTPVESYESELVKYHIHQPKAQQPETESGKNDSKTANVPESNQKKEVKSASAPSTQPPRSTKLSLISVNVNKLDKLMNLVGEIVIGESMVTKNPELKGLELNGFNKAARQLRKLTDELQDIVMSIRMVPIAGTFHKMERLVRDMSRKLNKDVEFVTTGEDTEVDKNIIDHLYDPLMHLIRNAMDHGVESEEERKAKGKTSKARVTLSAQDTGGDVMISVSDDGRGLNKDKILKKARDNGLLTKPESEMTEKEIFSLIMLPGFSTNEKVTEYSGRGVGMDVVKRNIEEVGGSVSIKSVEGGGTTFSIIIPLTLAIADAMQLSVGNCVYTLPMLSIMESFRPKNNEIIYDNVGNEMIMVRGNVYPIIRLHKLFHIDTDVQNLEDGILIMVEGENKSACIFVDKLIGEQQVVVKPIPQYLSRYKVDDAGLEGCTILGDGSISLILNAKALINRIV